MDNVLTSVGQLIEIVSDSFFSIIGNVFLYTIIGLVLAIVMMTIIARKRWAKRENGFWNFLTIFHYVAFLAAFMITLPIVGGVRAVHSMADEITHNYLKPTVEQQIGNVQKAIASLSPKEQPGFTVTVQDASNSILKDLKYTPATDEFFGEEKAELLNWIITDLGGWAVVAMVNAMADVAVDGAAESIGLDPSDVSFSVAQISSMDYSKVSAQISTSVDKSVSYYVDSFFNVYYFELLLLFTLIITIPVIEMLFYNLYWKKRKLVATVEDSQQTINP